MEPTGALKLAISLAPMLGAFAAAWAILRGLWRMDEMQRRIQFDAIAISFLGTALITFGWSFAEERDCRICEPLLSGLSWARCGASIR
jgi:hypothetical protein